MLDSGISAVIDKVQSVIIFCQSYSVTPDPLPYSLDIIPPSIIKPPYYLHKFAAEVYLSPIYAPIDHT